MKSMLMALLAKDSKGEHRPASAGRLCCVSINNSYCSFTPSLLSCYHIKTYTTVSLLCSNSNIIRFNSYSS